MSDRVSLPRNLNQALSVEELRLQLGELVSRLEDYLNQRIEIHVVESKTTNKQRSTFHNGDLVLDLTIEPGIATLQQWDGKKLVPLGFNTITGNIDLITRGIGSGFDRTKILGSKGDDTWELRIPDQIKFNATEFIPAFSLATATGEVADSNELNHRNRIIGMVMEDVANGFVGQANVDGEVTNPAWVWSPGTNLFLNGTIISVTAPTVGFSQLVAVARTSDTIIMKIAQAVLL